MAVRRTRSHKSRAAELHKDAIVVDTHDDLIQTCIKLQTLGDRATFAGRWIPELREGGVDVQVVPIWTEGGAPEASLRSAMEQIAAFYREVDANPNEVAACGTGEEIRAAVAEGQIAMVLAMEGASSLGGDPSLLSLFFRLGLRMVAFTHMGRTAFGDGSRENATSGRLTAAGIAALAEMERLGIVADVSHLGFASTEHLLELATRPVVASHSSAHALRDHHRNLTDAQLRGIAKNGGVVGVNVLPAFIDPERPTISRVVDHIDHMIDVMGPKHIGLGPDFIVEVYEDMYPPHAQIGSPGINGRQRIEGLYAPRHLPALTEELLRRGFNEDVVRDILGRNFLRVFDEVLGRPKQGTSARRTSKTGPKRAARARVRA